VISPSALVRWHAAKIDLVLSLHIEEDRDRGADSGAARSEIPALALPWLSGARATARSFGRVAHQLWLEVTGFTFFVLAVIGGSPDFASMRNIRQGLRTGPDA